MQCTTRRMLGLGLAVLLLTAVTPWSIAQGYPVRPVRIIVPLAAGGGMDSVTRVSPEAGRHLRRDRRRRQPAGCRQSTGPGDTVVVGAGWIHTDDGERDDRHPSATLWFAIRYPARVVAISQVTQQGYALVVHSSSTGDKCRGIHKTPEGASGHDQLRVIRHKAARSI